MKDKLLGWDMCIGQKEVVLEWEIEEPYPVGNTCMDSFPPTVEWLEYEHILGIYEEQFLQGLSGKLRIWEDHPLYWKLWRENNGAAPQKLSSEGNVRKRTLKTK